MHLVITLDVMMAKKKMRLNELSEKAGIHISNLSVFKNGKAKEIKFSTLVAICEALDCNAADILDIRKD